MGSWSQPTANELALLGSLAGRPESRGYFFDRLDNPLWVEALQEAGFFAGPPDPVEADPVGSMRFPPWPEGRYLVRMAPVASNQVCSVLKEIEQSRNPVVTRHCFEVASGLHDDQLKQLAHRVFDWVKAPGADRFAGEAAVVICRLLLVGRVGLALKAARALLAVKEKPSSSEDGLMAALRVFLGWMVA